MSEPLRVGIAGLGTVGVGVVKLLAEQEGLIAKRAGRRLAVTAVSARDRSKKRAVDVSALRWYDDSRDLTGDPEVDVVVELIGGADGAALDLVAAALDAGKPVVTANKALLAHHGTALAERAETVGVPLAYEAAVAGGIPIVKALREGLAANRFDRVYGILNGTCNFILSVMEESGREFADVLAEAQQRGYAEADPSFDVDGIDAAHKLAILTSIAYGTKIDIGSVYVEGIREIAASDIRFAAELGYRIKLLAIARRTPHGIEQRVHPCMVPAETPIAHVNGVFNAVVAEGDYVDRSVYEGLGAGAGPTSSAVVADLIDIASGRLSATFGVPAASLEPLVASPMDRHRGPYYIRLTVLDQPGVMADVAAALRDERVSIESVLQRGRSPDEPVPVVLVCHDTEEAAMRRALERIAAMHWLIEPPRMIRIEML